MQCGLLKTLQHYKDTAKITRLLQAMKTYLSYCNKKSAFTLLWLITNLGAAFDTK